MPDRLLIAYAGDCTLQAQVDVPDGRLSDFLNTTDSLVLRDAVMQAHEDGRVVKLDRLVINRSEILAVEATGTRGPRGRRISTRSSRMEFVLGPYRILGLLHAAPGADPLAAFARRRAMVPVTSATIAYHAGAETKLHDVETLIVNRELVESVRQQLLDLAFENMPHIATPSGSEFRGWSAYYRPD